MNLYIDTGRKSFCVTAEPHPCYSDEILIGGERFLITDGTYKDIKDNSELIVSSGRLLIIVDKTVYSLI